MRELKAFAETYVHLGYEYFVIDNGWFSQQELMEVDGYKVPVVQGAEATHVRTDAYGIPKPSDCFFPNGFAPLIDYCRPRGIKLGLHLMRGIPRVAVEQNLPIKGTPYHARDIANVKDTCQWCSYMYGIDMQKPGAQAYLDSVLEQFAQWGVEFVKVDDLTHRPAEVEGYVKAVENASGPICLSLSPGNDTNKRYIDSYRGSSLCRITRDIWDLQEDIDISFDYWKSWQGLEREDFYPDLDMIPFGELCLLKRDANFAQGADAAFCAGDTKHHWCAFTKDQKETFITQRAMAASPLIIGGCLESMDEDSLRLLTNTDMLACNQNGVMGMDTRHSPEGLEIFITPEKGPDVNGYQAYQGVSKGWLAVFNREDTPTRTALNWQMLGLLGEKNNPEPGCYQIFNIWQGGSLTLAYKDLLETEIPPHGVVFYRFEHMNEPV
jgi:hypothetical protein